jgi:hypothetical protein
LPAPQEGQQHHHRHRWPYRRGATGLQPAVTTTTHTTPVQKAAECRCRRVLAARLWPTVVGISQHWHMCRLQRATRSSTLLVHSLSPTRFMRHAYSLTHAHTHTPHSFSQSHSLAHFHTHTHTRTRAGHELRSRQPRPGVSLPRRQPVHATRAADRGAGQGSRQAPRSRQGTAPAASGAAAATTTATTTTTTTTTRSWTTPSGGPPQRLWLLPQQKSHHQPRLRRLRRARARL